MKLRNFSLDAYHRGEKVVTRNGKDVRIVCTDRAVNEEPIVGLVDNKMVECWNSIGKNRTDHELDLFVTDCKMGSIPSDCIIVGGQVHVPVPFDKCSNCSLDGRCGEPQYGYADSPCHLYGIVRFQKGGVL